MKIKLKRKKPMFEGFPVVDAKTAIELVITYHDTVGGQKDPWKCAAAKCLLRMPGVIEARVFRTRVYVLKRNANGKFWTRYNPGHGLRHELVAFDKGGKFEPGSYDIGPPAPSCRLGIERPSNKRGRHDQNKTKRAKPHVMKNVRQRAMHYDSARGLR